MGAGSRRLALSARGRLSVGRTPVVPGIRRKGRTDCSQQLMRPLRHDYWADGGEAGVAPLEVAGISGGSAGAAEVLRR